MSIQAWTARIEMYSESFLANFICIPMGVLYDVTKIQTRKLLILLIFYFSDG